MVVDEPADRVFVTDIVDDTVSVLDASTGAVLRTVPVGAMLPDDVQRIAVDTLTNRVFVAGAEVQTLDARTGGIVNTVSGGVGSLAVDERTGRAFAADYSANKVSVLNAWSGRLLSTIPVGPGPFHVAVDTLTGRVFVKGVRGLSMLDARSGQVLRTIPVGAARFAQMVVDDKRTGRVFVVDPDKATVSVLDGRSGALVWTTVVGQYLGTLLVDAPRGLVILTRTAGSGTGSVVMLDARSGAIRRIVTVGQNPAGIAVDERTGRVFVTAVGRRDGSFRATVEGTVSVIDARSGAVLETTAVGVNPYLVSVDERTGRAFVVNSGCANVGLACSISGQSDAWGWIPSGVRHWLPFLPSPASSGRSIPGSVSVLDAAR
jgi:YVTN family beta-propeller protein